MNPTQPPQNPPTSHNQSQNPPNASSGASGSNPPAPGHHSVPVLQLHFTLDLPMDEQTLLRMMGVPLNPPINTHLGGGAVHVPAQGPVTASGPANGPVPIVNAASRPTSAAAPSGAPTQPGSDSQAQHTSHTHHEHHHAHQHHAAAPQAAPAPGAHPSTGPTPAQGAPQGPPPAGHRIPRRGFIVNLPTGHQIFIAEDNLMDQLGFFGLGGGLPFMGGLASPGDALSQAEYEALLNMLFNAHRTQGPPPTDESFLKAIPKTKVDQKHVDAKTECSICKDELKLGEEVAELPCGHLYHEPCVVPWLKEHNTCPYCRHELPAISQEEQQKRRDEEMRRERERLAQDRAQAEAAERERRRQLQEAYNRQRQRMLAAQILQTTRQNQLERERQLEEQRRRLEHILWATRHNQVQRELRRSAQNSANNSPTSTSTSTTTPMDVDSTRNQPTSSANMSDAMDVDMEGPNPLVSESSARCAASRLFGECILTSDNPEYVTLTCGHEFHAECLEQQLRITNESHATRFRCPSCLKDVSRLEQTPVD